VKYLCYQYILEGLDHLDLREQDLGNLEDPDNLEDLEDLQDHHLQGHLEVLDFLVDLENLLNLDLDILEDLYILGDLKVKYILEHLVDLHILFYQLGLEHLVLLGLHLEYQ
jgi:hypothetical protein